MLKTEKARKARRNELQRARRALPGAAQAEARASRRSYWKKKKNYPCQWGMCRFCANLKEKHDL